MGNFFAELKRRHIYRVAAAYVVVAWLLIQLVNTIAPMLKLPDWIGPAVLVLLMVGFPVALLFAWIHQLASVETVQGRPTTGSVDWFLAAALVVVIALVSYEQVAGFLGRNPERQANVAPAPLKPTGIAIAVLPFANMSGDQTQEFFSDGMTEEITSALAKIQGLTVLGRTSAFQFKGQNRDLRDIGQALGASHLIEGSVRKEGNRVRITVQLIRADNAAHLWTENYDRELTSVFATQEDIATAIAAALRVPLGQQPGAQLVTNRTISPEAYDEYLRGRALYRSRAIGDAIAILEPVVAREPKFAPAWAILSQSYLLAPTYDTGSGVNGSREKMGELLLTAAAKAERAAQEALRLDPQSAIAIAALGDVELFHGRWTSAEDYYRRALMLDADEPDVLLRTMIRLGQAGRLKDALPLAQKVRAMEPFVPAYTIFTSWILYANGQKDTGRTLLEGVPTAAAGGYFRNQILAFFYSGEHRFSEAADLLLGILPRQNLASRTAVESAARLLRGATQGNGPPASLPALDSLYWVYMFIGAPDAYLDAIDRDIETHNFSTFITPFNDGGDAVRKTERFKALMRKAGLVDYWKARGWADLCHSTNGDDFECN